MVTKRQKAIEAGIKAKNCKACKKDKPWDPTAERGSKASGFAGNYCWDCHLRDTRETRDTEPGREAARAAWRRHRAKLKGEAKNAKP